MIYRLSAICALALAWLAPSSVVAAGALEGPVKPYLGEPRLEMQQLFQDERFPNIVVWHYAWSRSAQRPAVASSALLRKTKQP